MNFQIIFIVLVVLVVVFVFGLGEYDTWKRVRDQESRLYSIMFEVMFEVTVKYISLVYRVDRICGLKQPMVNLCILSCSKVTTLEPNFYFSQFLRKRSKESIKT